MKMQSTTNASGWDGGGKHLQLHGRACGRRRARISLQKCVCPERIKVAHLAENCRT